MSVMIRLRLYALLFVFCCCAGMAFVVCAQAPTSGSPAESTPSVEPKLNRVTKPIDNRISTRIGGTVYQRMKATREEQRRTNLHGSYQTAPNATGALPRYTHSAAEQAQSGEDEKAAGMGKALPVRSRLTPPPVGTSGATGSDSLRSRAPYQPYSRARASAAPGLGGEVLPYAAPGGTEYQAPSAVGLEGGLSGTTPQEKAKEEKK